MRIAIVAGPYIPVPPLKYGGTEQVIYYLVKGLKELGHEPVLLATADSKVDCELIPIADKGLYFPSTPKDLPVFERQAQKINKRIVSLLRGAVKNVDIIHSHGFDLKQFQNFPNLTTIHGPIEFQELNYYKQRANQYYVSISKNQQGGFPSLQYAGVVYNGEDPDLLPYVEKPKNYVCFLGRLDRQKNPHLAIQLAINLGIKIKLAGKVDYLGKTYIEEEVKKYFDHPLVEYLGEIEQEEKIKLISNAKCNLHPAGFREPFGLTVLEAAYAGTPTLAIARGSMPELIEEGKTGMLVEDFVEGYHQIEECFKMDRAYIARRARKLFNYKLMAKQYVQAYQRVIDIFNTRQEQKQTLQRLTKQTKRELADIWKANQK